MEFRYKKLNYEFEVIETYNAGIILEGWELPSIRKNGVSLNESFITFDSKDKLVIRNSYINPTKEKLKINSNIMDSVRRDRYLLLNKKELKEIKTYLTEKGLTSIPAKMYMTKNLFKIEVAICRGKKNYDKRQTIKDRDLDREQKRNQD